VDHFFSYGLERLPGGLRRIEQTVQQLVAGGPDTITMHRGAAMAVWPRFAGKAALILQSTIMRADDSGYELLADPEDAVRLGADAFAVAGFLRGASEARTVRTIADCVKIAARWEMPVVAHVYPRAFEGGVHVSFAPEDIAWAVRCAFEAGSDVIKVPYCGDVKAYAQIVSECPVPVVAAGGPKTPNLKATLAMLRDVVRSGASGAVIGRNVWGASGITRTLRAMRAAIHGE
jgi:class I fructose-bisphosphate aldolase